MKSIIIKVCVSCLLSMVLPAVTASPAEIIGVVKRPPMKNRERPIIDRYRSSDVKTLPESGPDCACQPSLYSVIWLTGDSHPPVALLRENPVMAQKDKMFVPSVMAIPVGTTVTFPNFDPFFHNVFSYSKPKKFDLGRYARGESAEVTFDKPGIVNVFCEIHYSMKAYIHVLETPFYTVSDEKGKFSIKNVAPGKYTLHLWQENQAVITNEIEVGEAPLELVLE